MRHILRWKQLALRGVLAHPPSERLDLVRELPHIIEAPMHRRVAQIRHFIDLAQLLHALRADRFARHLAAARLQLVLNFIHRLLERDEADGAFLARFGETVYQLAAFKRLMGAVAFDDAELGALDLLVGGEAVRALEADAAAADAGRIPGLARVDDLVVAKPALWTTHSAGEVSNTHDVVASKDCAVRS